MTLASGWDSIVSAFWGLFVNWFCKGVLSAIIGFVFVLIGGWDKLTSGLFVLWFIDYLMGFACAWRASSLSFDRFQQGLGKFFLYVIAVWTATTLDGMVNFKTSGVFHSDTRAIIILYLASGEIISIMTHLRALGCKVPQAIFKRLADYRDCSMFSDKDSKNRQEK